MSGREKYQKSVHNYMRVTFSGKTSATNKASKKKR
jgi:hypothetical protein